MICALVFGSRAWLAGTPRGMLSESRSVRANHRGVGAIRPRSGGLLVIEEAFTSISRLSLWRSVRNTLLPASCL